MPLRVTPARRRAQDRLVDEGYNPAYGARPLRRAIMRLLEDSMAERMLAGDIKARRCARAPETVSDLALVWLCGCCSEVVLCSVDAKARPVHVRVTMLLSGLRLCTSLQQPPQCGGGT